jgi:hypothetical protein
MARIIPIDTSAFEQRQIIPRPQRPAGQELREVAQNAQSIGAILKTLSLASDFFGPAAAGVSKLTDTDAPKQRAALEQAARARVKAQRQKGVAVGTEDRAQYDAMRKSRGIAPRAKVKLGEPGPLTGDELLDIDVIMRRTGATRKDATDQVKAKKLADFQSQQAVTARRRQLAAQREGRGDARALTAQQRQLIRDQPPEFGIYERATTTKPAARPQPSTVGAQMPSYAERMKPRALTEGQLQQAGAAAVEREGKYSFDELRRMAALATDQKQLDQVMSAFDRSGGIGVHPQTIGEIFSGAHIDRARKELSEHTKRFVPQSALEAERLKTQREKTATQVERTAHTKVLQDAARARVRATKALASGREAKNVRDAAAEIRKLELNRLALEKAEQDLKKSRAQATSAEVKARIDEAMEKVRKTKEKLDNNLKRQRIKESEAREKAATELAEKRKKEAEGKPTAAQKKGSDRAKVVSREISALEKLLVAAKSKGAGAEVELDETLTVDLTPAFVANLKKSKATNEEAAKRYEELITIRKDELAKLQGKKKKTVLSGLFKKPKKTGKTGK